MLAILLSTQMSGAYEEFVFHNDIVPGATFEWKLETAQYAGDVTPADFNMTVGDHLLQQGDVLKVEVTQDPDEIDWMNESWLNVYVNDQLALDNSSEIYADVDDDEFFPTFPIYPVTYINDSGSYDLFQVLYDELKQDIIDNKTSDQEQYGDYIYYYEGEEIFDVSLENDEFDWYMYIYFNVTQKNTATNEVYYSILKASFEVKIDTVRGLLNQYSVWMYGESTFPPYKGQVPLQEEEGPVNGEVTLSLVREGYTPQDTNDTGTNTFVIPFEGLYVALGVSALTLVVLRKKRR